LLISISLLTGQFSDRSTAALSLSLSCSTSSQSNNMWPVVCSPLLQEHIGLSISLYLYKYDLILPCPVTIVVKRCNSYIDKRFYSVFRAIDFHVIKYCYLLIGRVITVNNTTIYI